MSLKILLMKASHRRPAPANGKKMTELELEEWHEWLEENLGIMFKIEWYRIILDEAQYNPLKTL
jgi:hypothetical protein